MTPTESQRASTRARIGGIVLTAVAMVLGFLWWLLLIPIMTMGTANCGDPSMDQTICNFALMNTLAFTSLGGLVVGLLLPLTLGVRQIRRGKEVAGTLASAWAIAGIPMLLFMGAGFGG
ncbi:hypothetical protein [Nocardiopsis salina]|uniref:hypothetical protein n=1 Tax=Nocardiopsis salina TaxID=245836 RepID=UPI001268FC40|nr:hypothetical protein [Nocardiopsis salina]